MEINTLRCRNPRNGQQHNSVIYDLFQRSFAEMGNWSPPQVIPNPNAIIRIHIRRFGRSATRNAE